MSDALRHDPLFSLCGLNCGLCPMHNTDAASKCPGCGEAGCHACGILTCAGRHGEIAYCHLCDEFPCERYVGADESDSFITHRNQFADIEKAQRIGLDAYHAEQRAKVDILRELLSRYNDGRRKSFFCAAVNLLPLDDARGALERLQREISPDAPIKEKAAAAVRLLEAVAKELNVPLKLRKKPAKG